VRRLLALVLVLVLVLVPHWLWWQGVLALES